MHAGFVFCCCCCCCSKRSQSNTRTCLFLLLQAYHEGWNTRTNDIHGNDWVVSTDWLNGYRSNGVLRTVTAGPSASKVLTIQGGPYANEVSDWAIQNIVVFNRWLMTDEIASVEKALTDNKYVITGSSNMIVPITSGLVGYYSVDS